MTVLHTPCNYFLEKVRKNAYYANPFQNCFKNGRKKLVVSIILSLMYEKCHKIGLFQIYLINTVKKLVELGVGYLMLMIAAF